jgi:hypothetical protein
MGGSKMRKQVLAFLSMIGLAASATPASPQVLKGSDNTSKESTVKDSKAKQENKAAAGEVVAHGAGDKTSANAAIQDKRKDAAAESNAAKDAAAHKMRKAGGEQNAAQDVVNEKVGNDRGRKAGGEQEDKLGNKKAVKGAAEVNAGQSAIQHKEQKVGAEKAAVSGDAAYKDKWRKANPQMGDGSVKTASHGSGGGTGKVAVHDIVPGKSIKGEKAAAETNAASGDHIKKVKNNAAETQAAQQNANKKAAKQVDQASPK